ncbi:sugar kinase [Xaviernesmea oryzae]|uniref:Sugar kinase n=1 Tax=Xaviernesmea oryzae TaxID=464029 RepID=A0A1Q9B3T9_9HYPH|nr:ROK family transcriptional regulator [Xaviernesmea oryzae]OLP62717.1 sugar kinase [Xaviernesmea oryzae]SEM38239.1 Sugar kinase of the NBD/HSP70 family, may contain an N-terminal HTH domain [Xaviernesmea oryzae]
MSSHIDEPATATGKTGGAAPVLDPAGGANQIRVRAHNERLVLSLVRLHGELSKAEIARRTGLSAQTVSVIMRALESESLLLRGPAVRGRVGQPSIPMRLNPDAVLSFGVKIGRRSADLVLMDFVGTIRHKLRQTYAYPQPEVIADFVISGIEAIEAGLSESQRRRIAGIGIAAPFELWNWAHEVGAPEGAMDCWREVDLQQMIAQRLDHAVYLQNDATAACGAELVFGVGPAYPDFVYFFIGSFLGGGVVINSAVFSGRTGTAGALGPLPVRGPNGENRQLLEVASIFVLEKMLRAEGIDPEPLWYSADDWVDFGKPMSDWITNSAKALAQAVVAAASVVDFSAAVIDGGFPAWVRKRLVDATLLETRRLDLQGVLLPDIVEGAVGPHARAIGGASLPIFSRYLIDTNVLFKDPV